MNSFKWTVLADNRTSNPRLETEHGLSILLETTRHRVLLDTGASDLFIRNADRLGIDLSEVDYVFISHGHARWTMCSSRMVMPIMRGACVIS